MGRERFLVKVSWAVWKVVKDIGEVWKARGKRKRVGGRRDAMCLKSLVLSDDILLDEMWVCSGDL